MDYINLNTPVLWPKEAIELIMGGLQWQAQDFELRQKSPYQLPFFYYDNETATEPFEGLPAILFEANP